MRRGFILGAMALQLVFLAGMAGQREWIARTGTLVTLRTAPLDPHDPMRGDYVRLTYDISRVPKSLCRDGLPAVFANRYAPFQRDRTVYATLTTDAGGGAEIITLSDQRPTRGVILRGRIEAIQSEAITVRWGVEALFLQQGKAKILEQEQRTKFAGAPLLVDVALSPGGTAVIKGHHWSPVGLNLNFVRESVPGVRPRGTQPAPTVVTAVDVELKNLSADDIAIIDLPGQGSFRLVADRRDWDGADAPVYTWIGADNKPAPPTPADIRTLKPGETFKTHINFRDPRWFVTRGGTDTDGKALSLSDLDRNRVQWFRIEYLPPNYDQPVSGKLQLGRLQSRRFNPNARVD